jgi:UDP-N-acetylglucosamine acyltransferase
MTRIDRTAVIGDDVIIGKNNEIGPYAVILGRVIIGDSNWIGPHVAIGGPAQLKGGPHPSGWQNESGEGSIVIGDSNVIREFSTVHQSTSDHTPTRIGNRCYLMAGAHVPHDAHIGTDVTICNAVLIGGHTTVGDRTNIGLGSVVHQRLNIGEGVMVGMGSVVTNDLPAYALAFGSPARVKGANTVGLRRHGVDDELIDRIDGALRDNDIELLAHLQQLIAAGPGVVEHTHG